MNVLHVVNGLDNLANGIAVAAKLLAGEQCARIADAKLLTTTDVKSVDEVWVHSCWIPQVWWACLRAIREHKRLVRMVHGNLDPLRLEYHGWKKRPVGPIERFFLRRADLIVATCEAEREWIQAYLGERCPPVEVTDIKRFFNLGGKECKGRKELEPLHLLYLGRRHPLKGVAYLQSALIRLQNEGVPFEFRVKSQAFGEEKEQLWDWCDILVLPTLSENFGLVIAEALERGKRVITTDGAPAWGDGNDYEGRLVYLKGYRDGSHEERVRLLKNAIGGLICQS